MPETITIPLDMYVDLLAIAERVETLARVYERVEYVGDLDVKAILDIGGKENGEL